MLYTMCCFLSTLLSPNSVQQVVVLIMLTFISFSMDTPDSRPQDTSQNVMYDYDTKQAMNCPHGPYTPDL